MKSLIKDKKGVFGLTAIQQFFVLILGIAILAYVIIVIMGVLSQTNILPLATSTVINESTYINTTGSTDYLQCGNTFCYEVPGFSGITVVYMINGSSGLPITSGNYSINNAGLITNTSLQVWDEVNVTYTFGSWSSAAKQTNLILSNSSSGITAFFSNISPVYSILAVLVIILVLVVLVRVVSGGGSRESSMPQL